jgi:hypothetical protein
MIMTVRVLKTKSNARAIHESWSPTTAFQRNLNHQNLNTIITPNNGKGFKLFMTLNADAKLF